MSIVLITGAIASGKSTVGTALADRLRLMGHRSVFIDLDEEVLNIHGSFDWDNERARVENWLEARQAAAGRANQAVSTGAQVVMSGPFYLQDEIVGVTRHLTSAVSILLYKLEAPLEMRLRRNRRRAKVSHDQEVINQDQAIRALPATFGAVVGNTGNIQDTVDELLEKIRREDGQLSSFLVHR